VEGKVEFYESILTGGNKETIVKETYEVIYHDLFRALFSPSPAVANLVKEKMDSKFDPRGILRCPLSSNLCHRGRDEELAVNAITAANCASILHPDGPVYFASHPKAVVDAVKNYAAEGNRTIVTFDSLEALHIDKTEDWESQPPSEFYSVFVD
jgi:hypothetical protein